MGSERGNLVLSRKAGEELMIQFEGNLVRVKVLAIEGNRIKLGIDCEKGIRIIRAEIEGL